MLSTNKTTQKLSETSIEAVKRYIKDYNIILDILSLTEQQLDSFFKVIKKHIQFPNNSVITITKSDLEKVDSGTKKIILKNKYIIKEVTENKNEILENFYEEYKIIFVTSDVDFALNVIEKNKHSPKSLCAKTIDSKGYLHNVLKNGLKAFKKFSKITTVPNNINSLSYLPTTNKKVYIINDAKVFEITLKKEIASGGEGTVYSTDFFNSGFEYVAKIYSRRSNTLRKQKKIELMVSRELKCNDICFPEFILYDDKENFVGYLMKKAPIDAVPFSYEYIAKLPPNAPKIKLVDIIINILTHIDYLHGLNVVLGDISANNILIDTNGKAYFVDTDSYQIEDFPCEALYTKEYSLLWKTQNGNDEEIKSYFEHNLRTKNDDYYAMAVLIFFIIMNGKLPYSSDSDIINSKFGDFKQFHKIVWDCLDDDIKKEFIKIFTEERTAYLNRACYWLRLFKKYKEKLQKNEYKNANQYLIDPT